MISSQNKLENALCMSRKILREGSHFICMTSKGSSYHWSTERTQGRMDKLIDQMWQNHLWVSNHSMKNDDQVVIGSGFTTFVTNHGMDSLVALFDREHDWVHPTTALPQTHKRNQSHNFSVLQTLAMQPPTCNNPLWAMDPAAISAWCNSRVLRSRAGAHFRMLFRQDKNNQNKIDHPLLSIALLMFNGFCDHLHVDPKTTIACVPHKTMFFNEKTLGKVCKKVVMLVLMHNHFFQLNEQSVHLFFVPCVLCRCLQNELMMLIAVMKQMLGLLLHHSILRFVVMQLIALFFSQLKKTLVMSLPNHLVMFSCFVQISLDDCNCSWWFPPSVIFVWEIEEQWGTFPWKKQKDCHNFSSHQLLCPGMLLEHS